VFNEPRIYILIDSELSATQINVVMRNCNGCVEMRTAWEPYYSPLAHIYDDCDNPIKLIIAGNFWNTDTLLHSSRNF
jgi:hypothetical protein